MSNPVPTIFSLGIKIWDRTLKFAARLFIVMTIIGGGIVTPVMGWITSAPRANPDRRTGSGIVLCRHLHFYLRFRSQSDDKTEHLSNNVGNLS